MLQSETESHLASEAHDKFKTPKPATFKKDARAAIKALFVLRKATAQLLKKTQFSSANIIKSVTKVIKQVLEQTTETDEEKLVTIIKETIRSNASKMVTAITKKRPLESIERDKALDFIVEVAQSLAEAASAHWNEFK
jgi:predicted glycosyl hydrolase (DUF1957 family)